MRTRHASMVAVLALGGACNSSTHHAQPDAEAIDAERVDAFEPPDAPPAEETPLPVGTPIAIALTSINQLTYTGPLASGNAHQAVILDTGSTTLGLASSTCQNCGVTPLYAPDVGAVDQHQTASSHYADGSGWDSEIFQDMTALGDGPAVALKFGAITSSDNFFRSFDGGGTIGYQGILGLGPDQDLIAGTTSYLTTAFAGGTMAEVAFQLCPDSGTMWLGGYDPSKQASAQAVTPMVSGFPFYGVQVDDMAVAGTSLHQSASAFGPTIIDTGTSISFIPTAPLAALKSAIESSAGYQAVFGTQPIDSDQCLSSELNAAQLDAMLPPMSIAFPGVTGGDSPFVDLPATHSYLVNLGGQWCFGFADSVQLTGGQLTASLYGDSLLNAYITTIDIADRKIGFAPQSGCHEANVARPQARATARVPGVPWWKQDPRVRYPSSAEMRHRLQRTALDSRSR